MNERIKLLADRAEHYATQKAGSDWEVNIPMDEKLFRQKFAELIVQECMEVANTYQNRGGNCYVDDMIAKHFGVKK